MNRRNFVKTSALASAGIMLSGYAIGKHSIGYHPTVRIARGQRKFHSFAVERVIRDIRWHIGNKEIAWMFENCFPNTLDTTVDLTLDGTPDTYVITGDIDAMWLRDSSAQVWPYLRLVNDDKNLRWLVRGVIKRQAKFILSDPYANAFYQDPIRISEWNDDLTKMKPGIHERKWEVDSLCYPIRLAYGYWKKTGDLGMFDFEWVNAMKLIIQTFKEQQRLDGPGPYSFMRNTQKATDTLTMNGYGYPAKPNGMIFSMFRPSDDATVYPLLVPSNMFAVASLYQLLEIIQELTIDFDTKPVYQLIEDINSGLRGAKVKHEKYGNIYAYEINGFGSSNLMDDANIPSLLSLPYLIPSMKDDEVYWNTRRFVLSADNPFFFKGSAGEGIGGPHVGNDMIWPLSIIMRGMTSKDDGEIKLCLDMLQQSHAGTGFMHESFHKDNPAKYTRPWFAWANTLFGEFVWKVYRERKHLLM